MIEEKNKGLVLKKVLEAAKTKKGEDIVVLDLSQKRYITDYIVIVSGEAKPHRDVIQDEIEKRLKFDLGLLPLSVEKDSNSHWIVLDYDWFVVHVMSKEARTFYDIEGLWQDVNDIKDEILKNGN